MSNTPVHEEARALAIQVNNSVIHRLSFLIDSYVFEEEDGNKTVEVGVLKDFVEKNKLNEESFGADYPPITERKE